MQIVPDNNKIEPENLQFQTDAIMKQGIIYDEKDRIKRRKQIFMKNDKIQRKSTKMYL